MTKTTRTPAKKGASSVKVNVRRVAERTATQPHLVIDNDRDNETFILTASLPLALLLTFGGSFVASWAEAGVGPESSTGTYLYIVSQLLCIGGFLISFITLCVLIGLIVRATRSLIQKNLTPKRISAIKVQAKMTAASINKVRRHLSI